MPILRLIIDRTCVQSVYAKDNYELDSRQRFYRIKLRSAFSTHVRLIINRIIVVGRGGGKAESMGGLDKI